MKSNKRILAAITASGAALWLTVSPEGPRLGQQIEGAAEIEPAPLSHRIEQLHEKIRASSATAEGRLESGTIRNIVQFFNFLNCIRGDWRNC